MQDTGKAAPYGTYPKANYAYYVIGVLMIAYMFAYLDRLIFSLLIAPMKADLNLTDTQIGLVGATSFALCFVFFSIPFGRWVDTRGRRNAIVLGMALWSLATMVCGLANSFSRLFVARMMVGVGEASLNPAVYSILPDYFPPRRRAFALSLYFTGVSIGGGIAILCGGFFIEWAEHTKIILPYLGQLAPWKLVFLAVGFPGLLIALLVWSTVREPSRQIAAADKNAPALREVFNYLSVHRKLFLLTYIGFCGFSINGYAFQVWGPSYFMRVHGFSVSEAGMLIGVGFGIFGTLAVLIGGLWSDWLVARGHAEAPVKVSLWAAWIQTPFFLVAYLIPDARIATIAFVLGIFGLSLMGGLSATMVQALTPNRMRGMAAAIFNTLVTLVGLGIAPVTVAAMSDYLFHGNLGLALAVNYVFSMAIITALLLPALKLARARIEALQGG
jgi:MFS family permease